MDFIDRETPGLTVTNNLSGFDDAQPRTVLLEAKVRCFRVLLKLFIYGYLKWIPYSRRLERAAGRYFEVMWPVRRLVPDHTTIADFPRDNGPDIRKTCAQIFDICRPSGAVKGDCVVIDDEQNSRRSTAATATKPKARSSAT